MHFSTGKNYREIEYTTIKQFVNIDIFFFQAEDGIRDFCLSRGLGDVYKRQLYDVVVEARYGAQSN